MFETILDKLSGYIIAALVALLLASAGVNAWQSKSIGKLAVENAGLSKDLHDAQDANATDEGSITTLAAQLKKDAADHALDKTKSDAALADARQAASGARQQLANLQQQRSQDYANDADYRAWHDALAPASVSDRLRLAAEASDGHTSPGLCGPSDGPACGDVDGPGAGCLDPVECPQ